MHLAFFSGVFIYAMLLHLESENSSPPLVSEKLEHVDVCWLLTVVVLFHVMLKL